jgi:glyoxylase-like metal-dependent hydrolase (beta-lactamase superfamily II)
VPKLSLMHGPVIEQIEPYSIYRICLYMPLPVDNVNIYFTPDPVPTLVDAPPRGGRYLEDLDMGLKELGYTLGQIERILVSHPHIDHFGCAADIRKKGPAQVWIYRGGATLLTSYTEEWVYTKAFFRELLEIAGVPAIIADPALGFFDRLESLGCRTEVDRVLEAGDVIDLASHRFRVIRVPGHTPWCTMFCEEENDIAFTGDFLLKDISSNPLVQSPRAAPEGYMSLKTYRTSLETVRAMGIRLALPGHGDPVDRPHKRIGELLSFMDRRKRRIRELLRPEPQAPYQIILSLFPGIPPDQVLLAVSEVLGFLEIFVEEGVVERSDENPLTFSLLGTSPGTGLRRL